MITASPIADRRTRSDGATPRGKLPPSCPAHPGMPASCPLCRAPLTPPADRGLARVQRLDAGAEVGRKMLAELDARPRPKAKAAPRAAAPSTPPIIPPPPRVPREAKMALVTVPAKAQTGHAESRNPRALTTICYRGMTLPLVEVARALGMLPGTLRRRVDAGWTVEQATGDAPEPETAAGYRRPAHALTWNGITDSANGWAKRLGIDHSTMSYRMKRGLTGAALFAPAMPGRGPGHGSPTITGMVLAALSAIHGPPTRAGGQAT